MVLAIGSVRRVRTNTWLLLLAALVWLAINVRWIVTYRRRQILDIDEASLLTMAFTDHFAALHGGLEGWAEAVWAPNAAGPLVPALTSIQFFVTGTNVVTAFGVPLLAGLAIVLLTYGLADRIGGRALAWPALLLAATAPRLVLDARAYHVIGPAAAMTTAALYCLIRSERFSKIGYSVGFGVFLGLMPLTRTMTIAFTPALILAAIVHAAMGPNRRVRLIHCAVALAVAFGVAASWLVPNIRPVFQYLTEFGYGKSAGDYGDQGRFLSLDYWLEHLRRLIDELYLPHTTILFIGLIAAAYVAIGRARAQRLPTYLRSAAASPVLPVALLTLGGLAALASSGNLGTGFTLPLVPAIIVLALWGLYNAFARLHRQVVTATVAVVALVAGVPQLDLSAPTARPVPVDLPLVGASLLTDGRGGSQKYAGASMGSNASEPVSAEVAQQWIAINDWGAQQIIDNKAEHGNPAFGFRDLLFNPGNVQLAVMRKRNYGVPMVPVQPTQNGNTLADYQRWLTQNIPSGPANTSCLLFTATGTLNEFPPVVDPDAMAHAAETSGFTRVTSRPMPNGRVITVWRRDRPGCR